MDAFGVSSLEKKEAQAHTNTNTQHSDFLSFYCLDLCALVMDMDWRISNDILFFVQFPSGNLRNMAIDMGSELENQNVQIDRINRKVSEQSSNQLWNLLTVVAWMCMVSVPYG